jgi:hypothetical protein
MTEEWTDETEEWNEGDRGWNAGENNKVGRIGENNRRVVRPLRNADDRYWYGM